MTTNSIPVSTGSRSVRRGTWRLQPERTTAGFALRELVRTVRGTFPVESGHVALGSDGAPTSLAAVLTVAGVDTAEPRRDRTLRESWFDVTGHPTMEYRSDRLVQDGDGWRVEGSLLVNGHEVPLTLAAQLRELDGDRATVAATGEVDRYAAGVRHAPPWLISRRVRIRIEAVLRWEA